MSPITFQHVPLERPKEEIRLVQILPGTDDIRLTLQRHEFSPDVEYVALSYEWGTTDGPEDICLDGKILSIRQNLYAALQSLRALQAARTEDRLFSQDTPKFWIDAICINQIDDNEKNHQVAMMGRIYRQAAQTIAWLGQEENNSFLAFQTLNVHPKSDQEWQSIQEFCNRSYFQRIWIVQEVLLSQDLHFLCGAAKWPWDTLVRFWDHFVIRDWDEYQNAWHNSINRLSRQLVNTKRIYDESEHESLFEYIQQVGKDRYCVDFRDKVYGFLGLLESDDKLRKFEVDYQISLEGLLIRLEAHSNPRPEVVDLWGYDFLIPGIFPDHLTYESKESLQWYWQITELLHCLSVNVVGNFQNLTAVKSTEDLELLLQTICWMVAWCGVDLFSVFLGEENAFQSSSGKRLHQRTITTICTCDLQNCSYQCKITIPQDRIKFSDHLSFGLTRTPLQALECRRLLITYNENVQAMLRAYETLAENKNVESSIPGKITATIVPTPIERTVFAYLLARLLLNRLKGLQRDQNFGNLVDGKPGDADLATFLPRSIFGRYRMTIVETHSGKIFRPPQDTLVTVCFEVTKIDHGWQYSRSKKALVACLFTNGEWYVEPPDTP